MPATSSPYFLRLIMAVSSDGVLAVGPEDDMSWTGPLDKKLFRLLTLVPPSVVAVGPKTRVLMPKTLSGRRLVTVRSSADRISAPDEFTFASLIQAHPGAWVAGGPSVAEAALALDVLASAVLVRLDRPAPAGAPRLTAEQVRYHLNNRRKWKALGEIPLGDGITIEPYQRRA